MATIIHTHTHNSKDITLQMLTSCTDKKGTSTHAGKTALDLQGKE